MTHRVFYLDVVSVEKKIFSGLVSSLQVTSDKGELGILYGHLPLLAAIKPGILKISDPKGIEDLLYISGGFLEVQRTHTTILADTVIRGTDLDASELEKVKQDAAKRLSHLSNDLDHLHNARELAKALAKLRTIRLSNYTMLHTKHPR